MPSTRDRNTLDVWIRAQLRDGQVHRERDLLVLWRAGPGQKLSEDDAAALLHERLKALEMGLAIKRAPNSDDAWWCPN